MAGIYAIINTDKKKIYIGSSQNVQSRIKSHMYLLKKNKNPKDIQRDYNNGDHFIFTQICDLGESCQLKQYFYEQRHILALKRSILYNKSPGVLRAGYGELFLSPKNHLRIKEAATPHIEKKAVDTLCCALNCQPGDILEYTPEKEG